jgi:hypothetical protein
METLQAAVVRRTQPAEQLGCINTVFTVCGVMLLVPAVVLVEERGIGDAQKMRATDCTALCRSNFGFSCTVCDTLVV